MAAVISFEYRSESEELGNRIAELNAYINVAQAEFLELLREFDEQRYWEDLGFPSCAHWLNFKCGIGFNAARERLRMAHALVKLPKIQKAFAEGTVSFSKVRAMTRVATEDNEDMLMNIAIHGTADHIERFVSHYRRIEKLQEPGFGEELHQRRDVTYRYDQDGCLVLQARIPPEQGALVVKALERAMDLAEDIRPAVSAADVHPAGTSSAETSSHTTGEREPYGARCADALCEVAETYLNNPENAGSTADRYQVVVHVSAETPNGHADNDPCAHPAGTSPMDGVRQKSVAHLDSGHYVSAETSKRIACDCSLTTIVEDQFGEPLNISRRSRSIPPPMRRALIARDGGCRFPGCTHHRFCDGHHIEHWQHGGETCLDNLLLLCRHHHRLVHEGGFDCRKSETGEIYFTDQRQRRLEEFERRDPVSVDETLAWMYRRFDKYRLDSNTSAAKWYAGDVMDYDHALMVAFQQPPEPT